MTALELTASAEERSIRNRRLKAILLPVEHGGWGLTLEPVIAGLIVAPSLAGVAIALLIVTAFLARQPLRIVVRPGANRERFRIALTALSIEAITGLALLVLALWAAGPGPFVLLLGGAPLALFLLWRDRLRRSRDLSAELAAALFMALGAAAIVVAGGKSMAVAATLGSFMAARSIGAILHVRERVKARKGAATSKALPVAAHATALAGSLAAVMAGLANLLAPAAFALLLGRTMFPVSHATPAQLGWSEVKFGVSSLMLLGFSLVL